MPSAVTEVLRFCVVIFLAAVGAEVGGAVAGDVAVQVGAFAAPELGLVLGAALGYVLGGSVARLTGRTVVAAESSLASRSPEHLLAGLTGSVLGVLLAAGLTWPVLLLGSTVVALPVFTFVCVTMGVLGYRLGITRRAGLLALLGPRAGLHGGPAPLASLPLLLDSSVAVDGRIVDVARAGFLHGQLLVPQPVLDELQGLADAGDDARRGRGRRGLDTLEALRRERGLDVEVVGDGAREVPEVDAKLMRMALDRGAALLTLDANLAKVAALAGCRVMNLHALAVALRPPVLAGDTVRVLITRTGKEPGQGVGYLDDGTMVVVERAGDQVGSDVAATVTSVLTTAGGRMVFCRPSLPSPRAARGAG